jgi:hypothetical protein
MASGSYLGATSRAVEAEHEAPEADGSGLRKAVR